VGVSASRSEDQGSSPVAISATAHSSAQMSLPSLNALLLTASGLMYVMVPRRPVVVASLSEEWPMPKSDRRTLPLLSTNMLAGLVSR
jgi:hypothetical protein